MVSAPARELASCRAALRLQLPLPSAQVPLPGVVSVVSAVVLVVKLAAFALGLNSSKVMSARLRPIVSKDSFLSIRISYLHDSIRNY